MLADSLPFQPKLPARIAGIVFWVLVLISLVVAIYVLNDVENKIDITRKSNVYLLSHEIETLLKLDTQKGQDINKTRQALELKVDDFRELMGFSSVHVKGDKQDYKFGLSEPDDDVFLHEIFHRSDNLAFNNVKVKIYFTSKEKIVADLRKNMLLGIGIGILVIGFFLRYVLNILLTRPFVNMLESAKGFTQGDESIRFDESRQDEFGYLGRFINNALRSILGQQEALVDALDKVSTSEIALMIEKEMAEVTLRSITDSVLTVDQKSIIRFVNPAAEKLLESSLDELIGKPFSSVLNVVDDSFESLNYDPVKTCFEQGTIVDLPSQSSFQNKKSHLIAIEASVAPMKNNVGDLLGAVIVIQDVSQTRKLTHQLSYQASHDALTGLYNRRKFESHLQEVLVNTEYEDGHHVLLYLDLDQFKIVNDTCGHIAGDELLQQLPLVFNKVLRSGDVVARLGGDEFGVLLENCSLDKSIVIADKIRQHVKDFRFVWGEKSFEIGVSIGIVAIDSEHIDMTHIFSSADIACYAAKDAGRNRVHVYEESDEAVSKRHGEMHWTARITQAMEEDRFVLYKQNIVNIEADKLEHVEVLIRMVGEDGSIILPGAFLPAAERYNLMATIDRWVISHVFELIGANADREVDDPLKMVAINLSGDSLSDDGLLEFIYSEKDKYQVLLERVCFEITETVAISNLSHAVCFMEALKQHGCKFALDDFGSGLSSFAYLKSLPVHYLKIDGSFVRDIGKDEIDRAMVKSIQQVAEAMNLMTVAEWVEDAQTLDILKELGVDCAQGNYLMAAQPIISKKN